MRRRIKRKTIKFIWPTVITLGLCFGLFLVLLFLGLPLLARLSLFFEKLSGGEEIISVNDQTSPFPPQLEAPFTATNSARMTLNGVSEPNSTVKLYLNNFPLDEILVGKDGGFSKRITLREGKNEITAQAIDQADNKSSLTPSLFIYYKKEAPFLEIHFPPEKEFETKEEEIEIKGETDPENSLTINGRFVLVKSDGSFSHSVSLTSGENLIEIVVTDQTGNETKKELKVVSSTSAEND